MQIKTIKYQQFESLEDHWKLEEINLTNINLLIGKNAAGKTKTLNIINGLSSILGENRVLGYSDGDYDVTFIKEEKTYQYILRYKNNIINEEKLLINDVVYIDRSNDGKGEIQAENGNKQQFEIPTNEIQATRRDKVSYSYLEDLYIWASHVRLFNFSNQAGKNTFGIKNPSKEIVEFNLKNTDGGVIPTFNIGEKTYGKLFTDKIIADFNSIGFNIESIKLGSIANFNLQIIDNPNAEISGITVKEKDLECWTNQMEMSTGMYRALSVIISFNYYEIANISGTVLIDDIGEGLDYERSSKLIELLILRAEQNKNMQLIMTTNDSFIMNSVDLKYWQIIDRVGPNIKYYNHLNSPQTFKDYELTGLNHFDFFASGFFKDGFSEK